jgi:hypothetical protein
MKKDKYTNPQNANPVIETSATYKIGNSTVLVERIFRSDAETLADLLLKLIKKDFDSS